MPITNIRKLLIDLAKKEKEEIKIAKILAFYYPNLDLKDRKTLFESILYYYKISESTEIKLDNIPDIEDENELENLNGKDYRIKSIEVSDLRGIPEKDANGVPFGIDFSDNDIINNAVILANNGSGKSSIFAGMEMIFAQEIGEKCLRVNNYNNLKKVDYDKYLKRFPNGLNPQCVVDTNEGSFDLENIVFENERTRRLLNPENHFISDFDIYNYGQKEYDESSDNKNSFHSLIAKSLGLEEFINIQTLLKEVSIIRRLKENKDLKALQTKKNEALIDISNFKAEVQSKKITLHEFEKIERNNKSDINKTVNERIRKLKEFLNQSIYYNIDLSIYLERIEKYQRIFKERLSISKDEIKSIEVNFLAAGIELIHEFDDCPFCQNSKKSLEEIQEEVEVRLNKLKQSQTLDEELRMAYLNLSEFLVLFYKNTSNLYNIISIERNNLVSFNELENLSTIEEELYFILSPILHDEDLIEILSLISKKSYPNDEDYRSLFDIINHPVTKNNPGIIEKINHFIVKRKEILETQIELISEGSPESSMIIEKALLEDDIKRLNSKIETAKELNESLDSEIEKAEEDALLVTKIKKEVTELLEPINSEINKLVKEAFNPIQDIVETILNDYLIEDQLFLRINKNETKKIVDGEEVVNSIIQANIESVNKETGEVELITPDQYFNTFRYKLFCLMISLSLALATRKKYNVNLPLVMDDLFFASDFISKNSFAEFLQKVIQLFYKYTPNLPLQFILFTHDDLIFRSALDAIETFNIEIEGRFCDENKKLLVEKTIIGRLFDPKDKDEIPSKFDNKKEYWNLLYNLSKSINQLVKV